jgi:hypothetical protein
MTIQWIAIPFGVKYGVANGSDNVQGKRGCAASEYRPCQNWERDKMVKHVMTNFMETQ